MRTAIFLPAKGTSERIDSKNKKLLDGKPLFLHTLEKLAFSDIHADIYLDSECDEILDMASHIPCNKIKRDPSLATNKTDGNALFHNEVINCDADIIVQILGTSPFIEIATIEAAIYAIQYEGYDSAVLMQREKQYTWGEEGPNYNADNIPNSKDLPWTDIETMGLYAVRRDVALETKKRIGKNPKKIYGTKLECMDVNYPDDFVAANLIASGAREEERKLLKNIATHLSSPILSDLLDDLGLQDNCVVTGLQANIPNKKIFGRANTLKLRAMKEGEDFNGIYDALSTYETIVPNDVIVVENEISDYAYFGELNANLAIRSGAVGAIIGGKTRDNENVSNLDFPTFSTGYVAQDVRKRAVVDTMSRPIELMGKPLNPGDLIFADNEGVIIIPRAHEKRIMGEVFSRISDENSILVDIACGKDVNEIIDSYGAF